MEGATPQTAAGAGAVVPDDGPLVGDRAGIELLRKVLEDADFTVGTVRDALATEVSTGRDSAELPLYLRQLEDEAPVSTLIKLFLLGVPVEAADAAAALAPLELERAEAMGIVVRDGERVSPRL